MDALCFSLWFRKKGEDNICSASAKEKAKHKHPIRYSRAARNTAWAAIDSGGGTRGTSPSTPASTFVPRAPKPTPTTVAVHAATNEEEPDCYRYDRLLECMGDLAKEAMSRSPPVVIQFYPEQEAGDVVDAPRSSNRDNQLLSDIKDSKTSASSSSSSSVGDYRHPPVHQTFVGHHDSNSIWGDFSKTRREHPFPTHLSPFNRDHLLGLGTRTNSRNPSRRAASGGGGGGGGREALQSRSPEQETQEQLTPFVLAKRSLPATERAVFSESPGKRSDHSRIEQFELSRNSLAFNDEDEDASSIARGLQSPPDASPISRDDVFPPIANFVAPMRRQSQEQLNQIDLLAEAEFARLWQAFARERRLRVRFYHIRNNKSTGLLQPIQWCPGGRKKDSGQADTRKILTTVEPVWRKPAKHLNSTEENFKLSVWLLYFHVWSNAVRRRSIVHKVLEKAAVTHRAELDLCVLANWRSVAGTLAAEFRRKEEAFLKSEAMGFWGRKWAPKTRRLRKSFVQFSGYLKFKRLLGEPFLRWRIAMSYEERIRLCREQQRKRQARKLMGGWLFLAHRSQYLQSRLDVWFARKRRREVLHWSRSSAKHPLLMPLIPDSEALELQQKAGVTEEQSNALWSSLFGFPDEATALRRPQESHYLDDGLQEDEEDPAMRIWPWVRVPRRSPSGIHGAGEQPPDSRVFRDGDMIICTAPWPARRHRAAIRLLQNWHALQTWRLYLLPALFKMRMRRERTVKVVREVVYAKRRRLEEFELRKLCLTAWRCAPLIALRSALVYQKKANTRRFFKKFRLHVLISKKQKLAVARFYRLKVCQLQFLQPALRVWKNFALQRTKTRVFRVWLWWCLTGKYRLWRRHFALRQCVFRGWYGLIEKRFRAEYALVRNLGRKRMFAAWWYAYCASKMARASP
eukprot:g14975.t1